MSKQRSLHESIADIAHIAGSNKYYSGDSRKDINDFIAWAKEFEKLNKGRDWDEDDYISVIESFTLDKIDGDYSEDLLQRLQNIKDDGVIIEPWYNFEIKQWEYTIYSKDGEKLNNISPKYDTIVLSIRGGIEFYNNILKKK